MILDIRTLAVLLGIANFIQAVAIFFQYLINKNYPGIKWWAWGFAAGAGSFILVIMRDIIAVELISIVVANALHFLGLIFVYVGILRFLDRRVYWGRLIVSLVLYIIVVSFYTYIENDVSARAVAISVFMAVLTFRMAYVFFTYKIKPITSSANFVAGVFLVVSSFFAFRALATLTISPLDAYFMPTRMQMALFLVMLVTTLLLTFGLIIMINQRLSAEIKEAHESYERIFNTSTDSAVVLRLWDGLIVNVNDGFTSVTGFTREEVVGKTIEDINLWNNPAERQNLNEGLRERGYYENCEALFRRKDGSLFFGLISAKIITLRGVPHVSTFTRDITERKLAEEALKEERERLQTALDEVRTLRGIIPICANCKKIRDDKGYWNQVEKYIGAHSEAEFSHGICPECFEKLYPEYMTDKK